MTASLPPPLDRVFLLSPARCDGERAKLLLDPRSQSPLAIRLRQPEGAELGEVFSFLSGLYFRGKLTYAQNFSRPPRAAAPVFIITTDRGLMRPEEHVRRDDLIKFSLVDVAAGDERYHAPLARDATNLAKTQASDSVSFVLLGSIATGKYLTTLLAIFGERLVFPADFVGRGDMSRGGLLLRCSREGRELDYVRVAGAVRHGKRTPKLEPIP